MTAKWVSAGLGTLAAAAAMLTIGVGSAAADDIKPQPTQPGQGPAVEGGVRTPAIQGELRSSDKGVALANPNADVRTSIRGVPPVIPWVFSGAGGDLSACVIDGPYCAWWMGLPFDPNNP